MANNFDRLSGDNETRFSKAAVGALDFSAFDTDPVHLTTFDAGRLIPIWCEEVLPNDTMSLDLDSVIRQTTVKTPTMGTMFCDFYAFFVQNRNVNLSWKQVQGENESGAWVAPEVELQTVVSPSATGSIQIPVGSIADYYGFPTQAAIPASILKTVHDLKFRGYVMIYNEYFRDQNYQPPIPISYLNIPQGFFTTISGGLVDGTFYSSGVVAFGRSTPETVGLDTVPDGSPGKGALAQAIVGSGNISGAAINFTAQSANGKLSALGRPIRINKLHDYFTSGLPSPQKASDVLVPVSGVISNRIPVGTESRVNNIGIFDAPLQLRYKTASGIVPIQNSGNLAYGAAPTAKLTIDYTSTPNTTNDPVIPVNLSTAPGSVVDGLSVPLSDLRYAAAIQQYAEVLARGGSRYRSLTRSLFGIEANNPYDDIPVFLGHLRRELDLYQTAQTSGSEEGGTPQGNLAAFGYTSTNGRLFSDYKFLEHGYVHVFAVVRHRNIYSSYMAPDNFRLSALDFYNPVLANISEQPVRSKFINPFGAGNDENTFTYQEAWAEYRYDPDRVSGLMRPGAGDADLSVWNYADNFSSSLSVLNSSWLKSNSEEVLARTLSITDQPQFKGQFRFHFHKIRPMPVYSVPGLDIF